MAQGLTPARPFVSFLSDYGHADEFVGVCKSVMLSLVPDLQIIDITHELPPQDVRAGALTLVRAAQYLPDGGIVLAVVDPGVGTDRRLVGVEVEHGILLGPDNGLLAPAVAILGGAQRVVKSPLASASRSWCRAQRTDGNARSSHGISSQPNSRTSRLSGPAATASSSSRAR